VWLLIFLPINNPSQGGKPQNIKDITNYQITPMKIQLNTPAAWRRFPEHPKNERINSG
jgi:hypothetical protein